MSDIEWGELVTERLLLLEQEFNKSGRIRAHIHDIEEES